DVQIELGAEEQRGEPGQRERGSQRRRDDPRERPAASIVPRGLFHHASPSLAGQVLLMTEEHAAFLPCPGVRLEYDRGGWRSTTSSSSSASRARAPTPSTRTRSTSSPGAGAR